MKELHRKQILTAVMATMGTAGYVNHVSKNPEIVEDVPVQLLNNAQAFDSPMNVDTGINIVELPLSAEERALRASIVMTVIYPLLLEDVPEEPVEPPYIADFCGQEGYPSEDPFTNFSCDHEGLYAGTLITLSSLRFNGDEPLRGCESMDNFFACGFFNNQQVSSCQSYQDVISRYGEQVRNYQRFCTTLAKISPQEGQQ